MAEVKEITQATDEQRELRKRILSLALRQERQREREFEFKEEKKIVNSLVKGFLKKQGVDKARVVHKDKVINLCVVEPCKIIWDTNKLKQKLDKDIYETVVDRQITITDYAGMVELLKRHKVNPKEFKQLIHVKETVLQEEIDNCAEMGWVDMKQLKGAYKVEKGTEHLRLTQTARKD